MNSEMGRVPVSSNQTATAPAADQSIASLVGGIATDVQTLLGQHLELLRQEVFNDFQRTKQALSAFGIAAACLMVAFGIVICGVIGCLSWAVPQVHWWGWCLIIGGVLVAIAGGLYMAGKRTLASFNPLPDEAVKAVKENVKWITDRVTS